MISLSELETWVTEARRLGIIHLQVEGLEFHLTERVPNTSKPVPEVQKTGEPQIPSSCACGCPPWICTGKAPCKRGCSKSKCHPVPAPLKGA